MSEIYFVLISLDTVKGRIQQLMCLSITPRRRKEGLDTKLHTFLISVEWPISRFGYFTHVNVTQYKLNSGNTDTVSVLREVI